MPTEADEADASACPGVPLTGELDVLSVRFRILAILQILMTWIDFNLIMPEYYPNSNWRFPSLRRS